MWRGLVLTVDPATPPVSGAELRNWQNALALSEIGPVKLVSLRPTTSTSLSVGNRLECAGLTYPGEERDRALNRRRSGVDVRMTRAALERLVAIATDHRPDAIVVEGIPLFPFLEHLRPLTPLLVLDMHNVESDLAAQSTARGQGLRRWSLRLESGADRIRRREQAALALVDRVWVCSAADRDRLRGLFGSAPAIDLVPNGIPRQAEIPVELPPLPAKADDWPVILFLGHLGYEPNVDAAVFLAKQVFPLVQASIPTARLVVAGRSPSAAIRSLAADPAITVAGDPPDLSDIYARAHLTAVPLLSGGGTRIKILEAAAHGLPIVATPLAVQGLDLADRSEILLADEASGLAENVRLLCGDPTRAETLRRNARAAVMDRFGAPAIGAAIRKGIAPLQRDRDPPEVDEYRAGVRHSAVIRSIKTLLRRAPRECETRPIILFYNKFFRHPVDVAAIACGGACEFTSDRRKLKHAAAVVFHIPSLKKIGRIRKPEGQLWVAWCQESRINYPILDDADFMRRFDLTMTYERSADIWHTYLPTRSALELALATPPSPKTAAAPASLFQSATLDRCGRNAFARELMTHIKVDSYGMFLNNRTLTEPDRGFETKRTVISAYKFCLAFENSIAEDYVTEKFFDPFLGGSVPVYRGAPNVDMFAPGDHSYIDASKFSGPRELAEFLTHLDHDDGAYERYLAWRTGGLSPSFLALLASARTPFCRLAEIVLERRSTLSANRVATG